MQFSSCKKTGEDPVLLPATTYPEEILAAPMPVALADRNKAGEILKLNYAGDSLYRQMFASTIIDFKRWVINGKIRYSYVQYEESFSIKDAGYLPGAVVVTDEYMNELQRIHLLPYGTRTANDPNAVDGHDFILVADNHYIVIAYYLKEVDNIPASLNPIVGCKVIAPIIQEVKNGTVIWEWDGTDYPEFYTTSIEGNKFSTDTVLHDYMHINAITIDKKDNNLICSFRNLDQVLKLNRTTGDIIWRLGGKNSDFILTEDQKFLRQHHPTFADNGETLVLFDNGVPITRAYSRVVEFKLDEAAKKVVSFKSMLLPGNTFCPYMGSVQKTDSGYFIGGGSTPKIWEVSLAGMLKFEKKLTSASYRAYKY
jgi:hypothetical protein